MNNRDLTPLLSRFCGVKIKIFIENNGRDFKMREMSDVFEFENIFLLGNDFFKPFNQMFSRNFVRRTVDKAEGNSHCLQRADPARPVFGAFGHITNQFVRDSSAVVKFENVEKII